jgi:type II secretory pathway component PulJ
MKNKTERSLKLKRIEVAVAISLWALILLVVVAFLLAAQYRG